MPKLKMRTLSAGIDLPNSADAAFKGFECVKIQVTVFGNPQIHSLYLLINKLLNILCYRLIQHIYIHRLAQMPVHTRIQGRLHIITENVGSHGNNRYCQRIRMPR